MSGFVISHGDVVTQALVYAEVLEGIFGSEVRGSQIVIAIGDKNFEVRVKVQSLPQCFGDINEFVLMRFVAPGPYFPGQDVVGQVAFVLQFAADIVVEGGSLRALNDGITGIKFVMFTRVVSVPGGKAAV